MKKVRDRLEAKVRNSIKQNEPLFCIGHHLPDITMKQANFTKPVYFSECEFQGLANFYLATFSAQAHFSGANFQGVTDFNQTAFFDRAYFSDSQGLGTFNGEMRFNDTLFEAKEKIIFEVQDLSNVSFMNSDITRIRFSDKARWREDGGKKGKDRFTVIEEKWLEESYPGGNKELLNSIREIVFQNRQQLEDFAKAGRNVWPEHIPGLLYAYEVSKNQDGDYLMKNNFDFHGRRESVL